MIKMTDSVQGTRNPPIAIIGIGCRFPGGVANPEEFWQLLINKTDAITDVPVDRWNHKKFYHPNTHKPGKTYAQQGGFLQENVHDFDPLFFGISPREAEVMDPQQRYLLKVTYEAFEDAGLPLQTLRGSNTGVYVGGFSLDNLLLQLNQSSHHLMDSNSAACSTMTALASRISHAFDLRGPCLSVDTACSSSGVATHLACQSLWTGESELAVAGGVGIFLRPEFSMGLSQGGFLSKHGRCMAFDQRAAGYTRGEGCGIVILKRLDQAIADGDHIYSVILNTGINQDGATPGMASPNSDAQQSLIERVYREANLIPSDVQVIEAHGTGTQAGDIAECGALDRVMSQGPRQSKAVIGSVKTNIGHLEAAAGVAGLIKASLMVQKASVVPNIHFERPNPHIPFQEMSLRVPTELEPWPEHKGARRVSINSFGYGGTNAHIVLENYEQSTSGLCLNKGLDLVDTPNTIEQRDLPNALQPAELLMLPVTAQEVTALRKLCGRYADQMESLQTTDELLNLIHSAANRRSFLRHRVCIFGTNQAELTERLRLFADGNDPLESYYDSTSIDLGESKQRPLVFVFTGMGPQWHAMGCELYQTEPVFREFVDHSDQIFHAISGWSILAEMERDEQTSRIHKTEFAQPANFILQAGLCHLYQHYGLRPDAVVGHSVGEVAAAYVCGSLTLEDALLVSYHRSQLQSTLAGAGGMLAAGISPAEVFLMLERYRDVEIAAINSPESITLAGDESQLTQLAHELEQRGLFNQALTVEVPFHSAKMNPIEAELLTKLADLKPQSANIPFVSTVTATQVEGDQLGAAYWWSNVRQPVRFSAAVTQVAKDFPGAIYFQIGPHPVLKNSITQTLTEIGAPLLQASSLNRKDAERLAMRKALAQLFALGYQLNWRLVNGIEGNYIKLPSYPWVQSEYRRLSADSHQDLFGNDGHVCFFEKNHAPQPTWEVEINDQFFPYLPDHRLDGSVVFPGAAYVETGLAVARYQADQKTIMLQDLRFSRVLVEHEGEQKRLQTTLDPNSGRFQIHSRVVGSQTESMLHAEGRIINNAVPELGNIAVDLESAEIVDVEKFYADLPLRGLDLGRCFQTITDLRRVGHSQVFAKIEKRAIDDDLATHYILHPTVLDGAFQSVFALPAFGSENKDRPYVPVSIDRMHVAHEIPADCYSLLQLVSVDKDSGLANISLFDEHGKVLAKLNGVQFQCLSNRIAGSDEMDDVFYELEWQEMNPGQIGDRSGTSWLLTGDEMLTEFCAKALERKGLPWRSSLDLDSFPLLAQETDIVYLDCYCFEKEIAIDAEAIITAFDRFRQLIQTIIATFPTEPIRLHIVTQNAHAVGAQDQPHNLIGSSLNALGLLITNEHPNITCLFTDIENREAFEKHVSAILFSENEVRERAIRGGKLFRQILSPIPISKINKPTVHGKIHDRSIALRQEELGNVNSLRLCEIHSDELHPHEIRFKVTAASLNFKDVLKVYNQIDGSVTSDTYFGDTLGMDVGGVITDIGHEVEGFQIGDEIISLVPDAFRSHATVRADYVKKKPKAFSSAESASLISYMTAWCSLIDKSQLAVGERVLIHNATGGVGLAAIQVAQSRNAEIFATAGTETKRQYLRELGIGHVYDSRNLAFAAEIRRDTNGQGVDVVLSAMAGEAVSQSFELLAPFGRFIEIGKKNIADNFELPMRAFQENLSFIAVDLDRILHNRPDLATRLLNDVSLAFENGTLRPLPTKVFPINQAAEAFQYLARAQHIGKVAFDLLGGEADIVPLKTSNSKIRSDASYLVTGGVRGFGFEIAKWLGAQGAGQLVLVSRSGAATDSDKQAIAQLRAAGVNVVALAVDVSSKAQVAALIHKINAEMLPLGGVFHAAVVLEDAFVTGLARDSLERVLRPKLAAATYLHRYTSKLPLDIFFCFSSISALIGNQGQASYVLANAYLDALCQYRRSIGLPGTSLNWGAISEVGILSRKVDVSALFAKMGLDSLSPLQANEIIDRVLEQDICRIGAFCIDWEKSAQAIPALVNPATRFTNLLTSKTNADADHELEEIRSQLKENKLADCKLDDHVLHVVMQRVSELLKIPVHQIEPTKSISNMGIDSLLAVELGISLRHSVGVDFTPVQLLSGPTPTNLRDMVLQELIVTTV